MHSEKQLQIVLTTGVSDVERAAFAFNSALVSASSGLDITLFLAMEAPEWACEGSLEGESSREAASILDRAVEAGVSVEACSACFDRFCQGDRKPELRDGFRLAGLLTFVRRSLEVPTVTF